MIDGNHEDHRWLRRALLTGAGRVWKREQNLVYQPRPSVAPLGASMVGFLGGALHVDRPQKHNWLSGFPNYILRRNREHATALFNRHRPATHRDPFLPVADRDRAARRARAGTRRRGAHPGRRGSIPGRSTTAARWS